MPTTAIIVVDTDDSAEIDDNSVNAINGLVNRAENTDDLLFYVLPEGAPLHESVEEGTVSSILRYDPETEDPYSDAKIDEQLAGRDVEQVQFYPVNEKSGRFSDKETERGRSAYAGPSDHSNAPPWAGPPSGKGGNGNGNKGGNGNGNKGGNGNGRGKGKNK